MNELQGLFYPKNVLLYGVSESPTNLAKFTVLNLKNFGYQERIYLFGSRGGTIEGLPIFTSMNEIDDTPELAIILVPARIVPQALENCGKKGVRFAVIQSAGFSEYSGSKASEIEAEMLSIAQRYGMRFAGPNGVGLINIDNGLVEPFYPLDPLFIKKGNISLVAQSGGITMDSLRLFDSNRLGFNKLFSIGNKLNINECDYLSFLKEDAATKVIGFYLESFSDGRRFAEIASKMEKPIACLKSNRVPITRQIASFHTTALAGDDAIADCALCQAGIFRAGTLSELMDFFKIAQMPPLRGRRIGIICRSGGQAVTFADAVGLHNFQLAKFSDELFEMVKSKMRAGVIRLTNPLDLGDIHDTRFYTEIMEKAAAEPDVDGLIFGHTYLNEYLFPEAEQLLRDAQRIAWRYNKPVMLYVITSKNHFFRLQETTDYPVFTDENRLLSALSRMYDLSRKRGNDSDSFAAVPAPRTSDLRNGFLAPDAAHELLKKYNLPFPPFSVAANAEQAISASCALGYPVALKIGDADVLHKTEKRGVILDIKDESALQDALKEMTAKTFLIQKMAPNGIECFIGAKRDAEFGPVVFFGMGGIFVELMKDVSMRIAPIDEEQAREMIEETKVAKLLRGFRNLPAGDTDTLVKVLTNISRMIFENPNVKNIDINPLLVLPPNQGCSIVDAKIEIG